MYKGVPIRLTADFSEQTVNQTVAGSYIPNAEKKNL